MNPPICINCVWCDVPRYVTPLAVVEPHPQFAKCEYAFKQRIDLVTGEQYTELRYCKEARDISGHCGPDGRHYKAKEVSNG